MEQAMKITWVDRGREPQEQPNPDYPDGIDLDCSNGADAACKADLPYPAKRCGYYVVECPVCGFTAACTTAGRPDDPRSIKMPCKVAGAA